MFAVWDHKVKNTFASVLFFIKFNNTPLEVFLTFCNKSNSPKLRNALHIKNVKPNINKAVFKNI